MNRTGEVNYERWFQESDQIVSHMIDVGRVASGKLPVFAKHLARVLRDHQHSGHAERVGYREIAGEILEHRGLCRIDGMRREKTIVGLRRRLGLELGRHDVEYVLEMTVELQPRQHGIRMTAGAVGQDQLAPGKRLDRRSQCGIRLQW